MDFVTIFVNHAILLGLKIEVLPTRGKPRAGKIGVELRGLMPLERTRLAYTES
jgi:hypothetical protein